MFSNTGIDDMNKLRKYIEISKSAYYISIKEQQDYGENVYGYQYKTRGKIKGKSLTKRQYQAVSDFCHSDESSTIESNSKYVVDVKRGSTIEKHVIMVWIVSTIDEQHALFCESDILLSYTVLYTCYKVSRRRFFYSCC